MTLMQIPTFDLLRINGMAALRMSREWLADPDAVALRYADGATRAMFSAGGITAEQCAGHLYNESMTAVFVGRWAMAGFPVVTMGHRTAALLMATKIRPEDAETFVRCPWPAFAIRLPNALLTLEDKREAALLLVAEYGERWLYKLCVGVAGVPEHFRSMLPHVMFTGVSCGAAIPMRELASGISFEDADDGGSGYQWGTSDVRSQRLARSLLIGTCLQLSGDPRARSEATACSVTKRSSKQRDGDELPSYELFELHSAVKLDLHHAMRDYVREGGAAPAVQTLVAGHWKQQPHGPAKTLRKLIHVLPYWRGDVEAPVSARMQVSR